MLDLYLLLFLGLHNCRWNNFDIGYLNIAILFSNSNLLISIINMDNQLIFLGILLLLLSYLDWLSKFCGLLLKYFINCLHHWGSISVFLTDELEIVWSNDFLSPFSNCLFNVNDCDLARQYLNTDLF